MVVQSSEVAKSPEDLNAPRRNDVHVTPKELG